MSPKRVYDTEEARQAAKKARNAIYYAKKRVELREKAVKRYAEKKGGVVKLRRKQWIEYGPPAVQKPSALQLFQLVLQQGDIVRIFHQGALFGYVETIARNLAAGDGLPEQDLSIGFFAVKTALRTAKMYWGRVQELSDLEEWRGRPMWNAASETIDDLHDLYRWLGDIRACLRLGIFPKSYAERDLVFQREFDNIVDLGVSSDLPEFSDVDFDDIDAPDASENDASLDAEVRD